MGRRMTASTYTGTNGDTITDSNRLSVALRLLFSRLQRFSVYYSERSEGFLLKTGNINR